jgi:two-component system, NarL family, nitrate/nitrite response regulator NarL
MGPSARTTHVHVAVGVRIFREAILYALRDDPTIRVVGSSATWAEWLAALEHLQPDVTLLDLGLVPSDEDLTAAARRLLDTVIVGLVANEPDEVMRLAEAGVAGYITSLDSLADLRQRIAEVREGRQPCSPLVAGVLLRRVAELSHGQPGSRLLPASLTAREREVLALLEAGRSNKEIAVALHVQLSTVKNHVHNLFEKMHVHGRVEAVARYRGARTLGVEI